MRFQRKRRIALIQGVLIRSNRLFTDGTNPPSANSQSRLFNIHSFRAFLYTVSALSKMKLEPQGGEHMSAELDVQYENAWHSVA